MTVPAISPPAVVDMDLTVALIGLAALAALTALAIVFSRHYAARREHDLHLDLQEQRLDIERREQRLAERESRLDEEVTHLRTEQDQVATAAEERLRLLERIAAMTADEARRELLGQVEHE